MLERSSSMTGLMPVSQCVRDAGGFVAMGREPWLELRGVRIERIRGHFVEITYRASFWDEPARPVFRFELADGTFVDRIGAAPVAGAGLWIGRIPASAVALAVSPTNREGSFGFEIERIRRRLWLSLVVEGMRFGQRHAARSAILTRLIGWRPESDANLAWAIGSMPLTAFAIWRARRRRRVEREGIDRPRFDWSSAPAIRLVVVGGEDAKALDRTLRRLRAQVFENWQALVIGSVMLPFEDARVRTTTADDLHALLAGDEGMLVGRLRAGDLLEPEALACVAEQRRRRPGCRLYYGDEVRDGQPLMKPGWSPRLQRSRPFLARAVFIADIQAWSPEMRRRFAASGDIDDALVASLLPKDVAPLSRILLSTPSPPPASLPCPALREATEARASIIIPTRDHPDLLRRIIASIKARSPSERYEIVVVDNGSSTAEAKALFRNLERDPCVRRIDRAGPFNFSALCNDAAATCATDVLVFLNDDTDILSERWLDRLMAHALDPATGAVGAKLTYPDGRLQHIGVLVGMGESAGHFGALAPGDDPGWVRRNEVVHEVSAVTGACLAVARHKFDAVGGFDAIHLPIELSDIDLCLRLNARGWQTIVDPKVHLMHEESVSRGRATLRRLEVYGGERAVFIERWRHVLRDDPVFHPGLSLYRLQAALG